jgi:hypothetical protein
LYRNEFVHGMDFDASAALTVRSVSVRISGDPSGQCSRDGGKRAVRRKVCQLVSGDEL